jgi:hypothetical protein
MSCLLPVFASSLFIFNRRIVISLPSALPVFPPSLFIRSFPWKVQHSLDAVLDQDFVAICSISAGITTFCGRVTIPR